MITETRFIHGHSSFWAHLLPMAERVVRSINSGMEQYCERYESTERPSQRGLISETALQLYAEAIRSQSVLEHVILDGCDEAVKRAFTHLERMRKWSRQELEPLNVSELNVAVELSRRIKLLFDLLEIESIDPLPQFSGCGWLNACAGDLFADSILFEMKAVARSYRSIDVRQLVCYCALNFESKQRDIRRVCLFNPREGTFCEVNVEHLCQLSSGRSSSEVFTELIRYTSDSAGQY